MSKVSRSTYQKCAEENKRLKKDIEALVMIDDKAETKKVFVRWLEHFKSQREFNALMKSVAKEYIKERKDELPDFLTRAVEEPTNDDAALPLHGVSAMLPDLDIDKAEELAWKTDYACFAVEEDGNEINKADAGAFFLEGYNYAKGNSR
jgi:hypothetical protein